MIHTIKIVVRKGHPMFDYFDISTRKANNLYNTTLFYMRQVMTGLQKAPDKLEENEKEVLRLIEKTLPDMRDKFKMPTKEHWFLSYYFLNELFLKSKNPDYSEEKLQRQCAQNVIKNVVRNMTAYLGACSDHKVNKEKYLGMPKLPNYRKSGGSCTLEYTNQACTVKNGKNGSSCLGFPKTKQRLVLGDAIKAGWKLRIVTVKPHYRGFQIAVVCEDGKEKRPLRTETPERICAIDPGINNFAAISNNAGLPCLLFKGKAVKSANQWYAKECAKLQSKQTTGTTNKFKSTAKYRQLCEKRGYRMDDFMHKTAKRIITWCLKNDIDTIVIGMNQGWKQNSDMGKKENQTFEQLPFYRFIQILDYLCEWNGIRLKKQEESYTSQASFMSCDPIPVYKKGCDTQYSFSGKRAPAGYNGYYRANGFRGIYRNDDGSTVNADLNGSANIGRKAYPELFTPDKVNLTSVVIIRHPDLLQM